MSPKKRGLITRAAHGIQSRSTHHLRHVLLRSIESMPAPRQFAWRNFLFTHFAKLFQDTTAYQDWLAAERYFITQRPPSIHLIDLDRISSPTSLPQKKVAIQAHLYYLDLAPELASYLKQFPIPFDLLISCPHEDGTQSLRQSFAGIPKLESIQILITPNRGRDLGPLLFGFGKQLLNYDYFAHVHTKKSTASNEIGNAWRQYLLNGLLSSQSDQVLKIMSLLDQYGMIYPRKFPLIDVRNCQWAQNLQTGQALCASIKVPLPPPGYIEFPVGSMFWAKTEALKPLLEKTFTPDDFEREEGQTDNTIMHALERSLSHIALSRGFPIALLQEHRLNSFYP